MLHDVCSIPVGPNRPKTMRFNNRVLWIIVALLALAAFSSRVRADEVDTGIPDTLSIDSVVAFQGGIGVVPVRFYNDQPLTGIELTFARNTAAVTLDSVSFVGTRVSGLALKGSTNNANGSSTLYVLASAEVIPAGSGLLCKLYYSYANNIPPQIVTIDSTNFVDGQLEKGTWFTDTAAAGGPYHPRFRKGYLNIQASPPSFDSVWVAQVSVAAGSPMAVDLSLFNERDIKIAELAINYGNDRLMFDSVTFGGTRGESASSKSYQSDPPGHQLYIVLDFGESAPLNPGSGSVARLYFTAAADSPDTVVIIDSTSYAGVLPTILTLTAVDANRVFTPIFRSGSVTIQTATDVDDILDQLPTAYALLQNYPNPFNPTTEIEFSLPQTSEVSLVVFNLLGQQVRSLSEGLYPAGNYRVSFDGRSDAGAMLSSGMYFYRLTTGTFSQTRKMMLVK